MAETKDVALIRAEEEAIVLEAQQLLVLAAQEARAELSAWTTVRKRLDSVEYPPLQPSLSERKARAWTATLLRGLWESGAPRPQDGEALAVVEEVLIRRYIGSRLASLPDVESSLPQVVQSAVVAYGERHKEQAPAPEVQQQAVDLMVVLNKVEAGTSAGHTFYGNAAAETASSDELQPGEGPTMTVSASLHKGTVEAVRARVGKREFSRYVEEAVLRRIAHDNLGDLVAELERVNGPVDRQAVEEARAFLRGEDPGVRPSGLA